MSQASIEIVKEFFIAGRFFVLQCDDILLIKNSSRQEEFKFEKFVVSPQDVLHINNACVKIISWHTMKFTPSVLRQNPEIFDFTKNSCRQVIKGVFLGEAFLKMLVIPALPVSKNLRAESIRIMQEKGVNSIITFPSLIADLVNKIEARHVYLSSVKEVLRILKFYRFFDEKEPNLPF